MVAPRAVLRRVAAALAAVSVLAGSALFVRAVVASQGWWYSGFVSETGQPGARYAGSYQAGVLLQALGLLLLAIAVRTVRLDPAWTVPAAAGLLVLGSGFAATSAMVACSVGCPLPPYEQPTVGDVVHAGASVAGVVACVAAMGALALSTSWVGVRRLCWAWLIAAVPLLAVAGVSLLFLGRGLSTGTSEKLLLAVVIGWVLTMSGLLAFSRSLPSGSLSGGSRPSGWLSSVRSGQSPSG